MLVYKGTLKNKTSKTGLVYADEYTFDGIYRHGVSGIHACTDPYSVFLWGKWDEVWIVDLEVSEQRNMVVSGTRVKFLKKLSFEEGLSITNNKPLFAYYWAVNFMETLSPDDLHKIMQHVLTDEESVISWAENIKLFTDELKNHIVTPRYAYLWQLEGFVCDKRVEGLVNEYNVKSRASWTSSRQHFTG